MTSPVRSSPKFTVPTVKSQEFAKLTGGGNDPTQKITVSGSSVRIIGDGSNNGIVASSLNLTVDGKKISVPISKGQTPADTMKALQAALPKGYICQNIPTFMAIEGVWFNVVKSTTTVDMDKAMANATDKGSFAGSKLSVVELNKIVTELKKDGFSDSEKDALAHAYAGLFNGAEWNATKAAQKKFAEIKEQYQLPTVFVR